jgi:hypothetical protein
MHVEIGFELGRALLLTLGLVLGGLLYFRGVLTNLRLLCCAQRRATTTNKSVLTQCNLILNYQYGLWSVPELQSELYERYLDELGTKVTMVNRLLKDDELLGFQHFRRPPRPTPPPPPPKATAPVIYSDASWPAPPPPPAVAAASTVWSAPLLLLAPTAAQVNYVRMLAGRTHTELPAGVLQDRALCSLWIDELKNGPGA